MKKIILLSILMGLLSIANFAYETPIDVKPDTTPEKLKKISLTIWEHPGYRDKQKRPEYCENLTIINVKEYLNRIPDPKLEQKFKDCGYEKRSIRWDNWLDSSIEEMMHARERAKGEKNPTPTFVVEMLQADYANIILSQGPVETENFRKTTMRKIMQSSIIRNTLYAWAMPQVKKNFKKLPAEDQNEYFRIMDHGVKYLENFDYQTERKYYEDLGCGKCWNQEWRRQHSNMQLPKWFIAWETLPCTGLFTVYAPNGKPNPYRKLEAFLFRRYNQDSIGPETMKYWLQKAKNDLKSQ